MMLQRLEDLFNPTTRAPSEPPVDGLGQFYWHFIRQARWLVMALFIGGGLLAVLDASIPAFIGRVVALISAHAPRASLRDCCTMPGRSSLAWPACCWCCARRCS
jgi:ATP-binding cassette subfamily B multidrug efflux pump